ncbi:ATP-dependent zinc metalloprotease FtsH [Crenobacter sp. SG2303]|uniref:ATP-dependent zinc metalloprotease FtsH n=1 Tax=Crenobacter oryzisoli TaxID=3056844 RepID=A0ABT7XT55_9NEIS|nr:ATP-dependent zinc metalloprotease FtsH [Crenobacter sp. SG2303]MDN0076719.1 ATP-dependent zinc metalloprotease FtsH [Crenobacter sp. SG2303]
MEPKKQFSSWYFLIIFWVIVIFQSLIAQDSMISLPYSEFKTLLKAGKVKEITIEEQLISGTLNGNGVNGLVAKETADHIKQLGAGEHPFSTIRVTDPALMQDLEVAKVRYSGKADNKWVSTILSWVLPGVIFVVIWLFVMNRTGTTGGLMSIGKSKAKVYMAKETSVTFDDVAGIDEAKDELMQVVEFLKSPERYRRLGGKIPKGVLIVGAPGTGKTLLAKAVAGEAGVPFFSISGSEFVEMFVGVGAARVRDLFEQAEQRAPCIIFIDELDALGKARGMSGISGNDEREQTLNQLLVQMDGFDTNKGVIIMAATNRPEILDPALLRPGRFDRHVAIDRPDLVGREKILHVHCKHVTLAPSVELTAIAARTPGFAGADLANLVNEAALHAARVGKDAVDMTDFDEAIDRVVGGLEKKNRIMNPREKETVAYHEAGHALVAEMRPNADRVGKISIIPRGIAALGYTQQIPTEERYLLKKSELLDRIDVLLAGRVAEELVFGDVSTGAQNDLQRATDMARHMITRYGMSETLGLATFEEPRTSAFLDVPMSQQPPSYSERTAQVIDDEISKLLAKAHERVELTLQANRASLEALAKLLLEKEVVDRVTLEGLLSTHDLQPVEHSK